MRPTGSLAEQAVTIRVVRHASTAHTGQRYSGSGEGAADPGLAADAASQVAGAALDLDRWSTPRVLTSPARRCQQTAAVLLGCGLSWANGCGEPSIEPGISEVDFGRWEGLSSAQARAMDPHLWASWLTDPEVAPPGGTSLAQAANALAPVVAEMTRGVQRDWLLVGHATTVRLVIANALELPLAKVSRISTPPACVAVVRLWPDGGGCLDFLSAQSTTP